MKIIKAKITKYRNLENLTIKLSKSNAICGKNAIGKTNVLEAIYWCLTDKHLNLTSVGAEDYKIGDQDAIAVMVELDNGTTIERVNAPTYVKGKLQATTQHLWINGEERPKKTGDVEIDNILGTLKLDTPKGIDLKQFLINPLYITLCDKEALYKLITKELDMSDVKIVKQDKRAELFINYVNGGDVATSYKKLTDDIKKINTELKNLQSVRTFLDLWKVDDRTWEQLSVIADTNIVNAAQMLAERETIKISAQKYFEAQRVLMNKEVHKVFGEDVDWKFIEENQKDDSYSLVCYPLVKGKKTKLANGSTSEKILTGISVITNYLKHHKDLEALPLIFDEGETLDHESLEKVVANSQVKNQIITSIVRDEYKEMEIIKL